MRARFFNRPIITSFVAGFLGGFRYGQMSETLIAKDESFRDSNFLKIIPALTIGMGILLAIIDGDFRLNRLPDHALSTGLGFMLGSYAGSQTMTAAPLNTNRPRSPMG